MVHRNQFYGWLALMVDSTGGDRVLRFLFRTFPKENYLKCNLRIGLRLNLWTFCDASLVVMSACFLDTKAMKLGWMCIRLI